MKYEQTWQQEPNKSSQTDVIKTKIRTNEKSCGRWWRDTVRVGAALHHRASSSSQHHKICKYRHTSDR
jgi:phage-related protein